MGDANAHIIPKKDTFDEENFEDLGSNWIIFQFVLKFFEIFWYLVKTHKNMKNMYQFNYLLIIYTHAMSL